MTQNLKLIEAVRKQWGFEPSYMYCLATGKQLGFFFAEEFDSIAKTLKGSIEEQADELALRILASMRPGLKWNKMSATDLTVARRENPVETLAYLLNRLFDQRGDEKGPSVIQLHHDKIKLFQRLMDAPRIELWDDVLHMLLEIEAKWGCLPERAPFKCKDLLDSEDLISTLYHQLKPWHKVRVQAFLDAERQAQYLIQNPGAKKAFFDSWMERAPPTEATVKKTQKQELANFMTAALAEMMNPAGQTAKPQAQRPTGDQLTVTKFVPPSTKMPMRFGVKAQPPVTL